MVNIILTDHQERDHLLPFTHTRPVAEIRIGLWTIREKWEHRLEARFSHLTQDHINSVYPTHNEADNYFVNGALIPTQEIVEQIIGLKTGEHLEHNGKWVATRGEVLVDDRSANAKEASGELKIIERSWQIFQWNAWAIEEDLNLLRLKRDSQPIPDGVTVIGDDIFIDEGAEVMPSMINSLTGPVYIGKGALVMEGSMIRGALALMDHAQLKMGAKIYGATTIGPHCKVGGEVNNCVLFGYSNKAHDGFIGNSVIGEWCNLGADTNTSNLKNNYADVKIYNYALKRSESTGSQFCGLMMGDHAKAGINTMFNTGTVCGAFANVFGGDFPHRVIADFAWGGAAGFKSYRLADALLVAEKVMSRRSVELTEDLRKAYAHLHEEYSPKN